MFGDCANVLCRLKDSGPLLVWSSTHQPGEQQLSFIACEIGGHGLLPSAQQGDYFKRYHRKIHKNGIINFPKFVGQLKALRYFIGSLLVPAKADVRCLVAEYFGGRQRPGVGFEPHYLIAYWSICN